MNREKKNIISDQKNLFILILKEYLADISAVLCLYQKYYPEPASDIALKISEVDLELAIEDFSQLLNSMQVGTERIKDIGFLS